MEDYSQTIEKTTHEEMAIPEKQMGDFKQMFEKQSLQKKRHYLSALRQHNRTLMEKIKDFNEKVSAEVTSLAKKIVPKKKSIIVKLEQIETKALRQKFEELQKYKKQVETKRSSTDSLEFLLTVKQKFEIKFNQLTKDIMDKQKQIQKLKAIKEKSTIIAENDRRQLQKLGEMDMYSPQIEQLRMKVRQKSDSLRVKKQQFLSLYKQNKSNKSIILQPSPKEQQIKQQDPELLKLKQQYQSLGKKVQILKLKKATLVNQVKADSECVKKLQKLKIKYQSLTMVPS